MATSIRILAVTEGAMARACTGMAMCAASARQTVRKWIPPAPAIFSPRRSSPACHTTRDPWEAARFATHLAAIPSPGAGLEGIPTAEEIQACLIEIIYGDPEAMARIYTLVNQKGGVGKTTSAINLGAYLGYFGQRVLLVDLDPQANATSSLGMDKNTVQQRHL